jgi:hypothetical protein
LGWSRHRLSSYTPAFTKCLFPGVFVYGQPKPIPAPVSTFVLRGVLREIWAGWDLLSSRTRHTSEQNFVPRRKPASDTPHPLQVPGGWTFFPSRHSRLHHSRDSPFLVKRTAPSTAPHFSQISRA